MKAAGSKFINVDFSGAMIRIAVSAILAGQRACLKAEKASLDEAVFNNCDLTGAKMKNAYIHNSRFIDANLTAAD